MSGWKVSLLGTEQLSAMLAAAGAAIPDVLAQALTEEAQLMFAESQRMVPRRTGVLAASGQVLPAEVSGTTVSVKLGYGGAASSYALIVHENLAANHTGGRSAKYLEIPVLRRIPKLQQNLTRRIERVVKR